MKKNLLFTLAMIVFSVAFSQEKLSQKNEYIPRLSDEEYTPVQQDIPTPILNTKATNEDVSRIEIGMARNQRIYRREEARGISYHPDTDVISISVVLDPDTYPEASEPGIVAHLYSTDYGQSWSDPVVVNDYIDDGPNYYISGTLFNPDGNADVDGMFGVYQGTIVPNNNIWNYKAFGSNNLGGDNLTTEISNGINEEDGYWNIFGLQQIGEEIRCMNITPEGPWGGYTAINLEPIIGGFNGEGFDWELQDHIPIGLAEDVDNGGAFWQGRWQGYDSSTEIVWSPDGEVGYAWVIGISDEEFSGIQPQVYYTEDGGDSWDYVFLDFQTDEMQALLDPFVIETNGGFMAPAFFESAGVVNASGELELFGAVGAHSADIFTYPDSIGWQWTYPGDIANFVIDMDGLQDIIWVDSLLTDNVLDDDEGNYAGSGWQHRIHVARNTTGEQIFVNWLDTRTEGAEKNINPDLFGWSKGIYDYCYEMEPVCFTEGTLYETFYFFTSSSNLVYDNGDGFTWPTIQAISPGEFASNTSASEDPITVNYITGIEFPVLCWGGVEENVNANGISVSQNQPNPFTGTTTISISNNTVAPVTIEVSNMLGQVVYNKTEGNIYGSMEINLNASDFEAGVYFYTVTIGNESVSKKMIVE